MRVRDVMTTRVRTIDPYATPKEAAARLRVSDVSGMPVVDSGANLVGIVSATDLLRAEAGAGPTPATVGQLMTAPVVTIGPDAPLGDAARLMVEHDLSRLPVVAGGTLVGIVSRGDLIGIFVRGDEAIEARVRELASDPAAKGRTIEVSVTRGHVELRGHVAERRLADVLVDEVRRIPGVRSVRSTLAWPTELEEAAR